MIHVISGPPCAGKSTYLREHAQDGDLRVDYDVIATALGSMNSHAAEGLIKQASFDAREGAIKAALNDPKFESWIIHTSPSEEHVKLYEEAGAEFIELDPGYEICMERASQDERPQQTIDVIERWYAKKKGRNMKKKKKTVELKASNGTIRGYAATFIREPDSWGDVIKKGAFTECLERMKTEGKVIPLLWNHDSYDLKAYIGTVFDLGEDDHGLLFEAGFDDTPEAQRARELAMDGRLCKFSFAYDVLEAGEVILEDGRTANELRKLNIHEVSLVMYPANPDTSIIEVKSGRRNSKADEEELRKVTELLGSAQSIINSLLADDNESEDERKAKSEEPDLANDEEQKRVDDLIKKAKSILKKGETI